MRIFVTNNEEEEYMVKIHPASVINTISKSPKKLIQSIIHGIQEKKGHDIVTFDLEKLKNSVTGNFIICHGDSITQVDAIAKSVLDTTIEQLNEKPVFTEGIQNKEWILLDYIDVVVHIFLKEKREYYGIEDLWADAQIQKIANNY